MIRKASASLASEAPLLVQHLGPSEALQQIT